MALVTDLVSPAPDPATSAVHSIVAGRDAYTVAPGIPLDTGTAAAITPLIEFRMALHPAGPAVVDVICGEGLSVAEK